MIGFTNALLKFNETGSLAYKGKYNVGQQNDKYFANQDFVSIKIVEKHMIAVFADGSVIRCAPQFNSEEKIESLNIL